MQSLFLRGSRGRRRGRRWTWEGWRACLSTPRETHNQRTTDANIPNCATPQSAASKHPELCATHYTIVRQSTENGTLRSIQMHQTPRTVRQDNSHLHMLSRPQCAHVVAEALASHQKSTAMKDRASLNKAKRPYEEMASSAACTNSHKMRWQPHMITIS